MATKVGLCAAIALVVAGCSSGTGTTEDVRPASPTTALDAAAPTSTPDPAGGGGPRATSPTSLVEGIVVAAVGDTVTTRDGNVVTLHSFEVPLDVAPRDPARVYAAADVEACAGDDADDAGVAPQFFHVELRDHSALRPIQPVKQPALQPTELAPGRCARGWISFSLPRTLEPIVFALRSSSEVAWRLV